ncbi:GlxA family transcriptional regulator [Limnoglobus roseus]|uniref:GlxA family transcriptional regulator n=1 Tax=Limnoglobus roseus TaxID=2598579 RepID=A0A5C1AIX2_9BACT|nr:GlxA family transcriptional regulator [Limnoglobus roseus]
MAAFEIAGANVVSGSYRLRVVSPAGGPIMSSSGLVVLTEAVGPKACDTFVVTGGDLSKTPPNLMSEMRQAILSGITGARRVGSVCTGAFFLANADLLNGRRATTHWRHAAQLQRQFPKAKVEGESIFTKDGKVWTSAGISAGIDLALAMIEDDLGRDASRATAQLLVVHYRRPGGQSQFSSLLDLEPESDRMRDVLEYIREHIAEKLSLEHLADVASLSSRQFGRVFFADTGETPAKAVERIRAEVARSKLEGGDESVESIARKVGFADPERMRRAFMRVFGHSPQSIRRMSKQS